jgi:hypothetical protein
MINGAMVTRRLRESSSGIYPGVAQLYARAAEERLKVRAERMKG